MERRAAIGIALAFCGLGAGAAHAQAYPAKPVRIVTAPAGGGNDFPARLIARGLTAPLGQQVIVDNRPAVLISEHVAKSPPDGYTLLVTGSSHWIGPLVEKVSYDPIRDFSMITLVDRAPAILVVHPSVPAKNVKELVALAKARPGQLNFSQGAPGTSGHTGALMFEQIAHVKVMRIPYKGTGPALAALVTGEVHGMFGSAGGVAPHLKSGRLRGLAVGSAQRSPLAPELPTLESSGLPGFIAEVLHGMFAPARTPPEIVARLNQEVSRYLQSAEAKDVFLKAGIETSPSTPDELAATIKAEMARTEKLLAAAR